MNKPMRFMQVGTGGFGGYWCREVLPRLVKMGKAEPAAAVDINSEALSNAQQGYGIAPEHCFTEKRLAQQPAWMNPWLAEMFVDWLSGGPEPPNSLDDNIQCAALLFAAVESAHTGKVVDVQEFLKGMIG